MSQIQYKFNKNDEYYTPAYAVKPLLKYLPQHSNIWCPFDTDESQFVKVLDFDMFEKYGCEMMWLSPRVSYIRPDCSNSSVPFQSGYLCYKMLPSQLVFERINKKEDVFG